MQQRIHEFITNEVNPLYSYFDIENNNIVYINIEESNKVNLIYNLLRRLNEVYSLCLSIAAYLRFANGTNDGIEKYYDFDYMQSVAGDIQDFIFISNAELRMMEINDKEFYFKKIEPIEILSEQQVTQEKNKCELNEDGQGKLFFILSKIGAIPDGSKSSIARQAVGVTKGISNPSEGNIQNLRNYISPPDTPMIKKKLIELFERAITEVKDYK